jgi:hypothetical protein
VAGWIIFTIEDGFVTPLDLKDYGGMVVVVFVFAGRDSPGLYMAI